MDDRRGSKTKNSVTTGGEDLSRMVGARDVLYDPNTRSTDEGAPADEAGSKQTLKLGVIELVKESPRSTDK